MKDIFDEIDKQLLIQGGWPIAQAVAVKEQMAQAVATCSKKQTAQAVATKKEAVLAKKQAALARTTARDA